MATRMAFTGAPGVRLAGTRPARIRTGRTAGGVVMAAAGGAARPPAVGVAPLSAAGAGAEAAAAPAPREGAPTGVSSGDGGGGFAAAAARLVRTAGVVAAAAVMGGAVAGGGGGAAGGAGESVADSLTRLVAGVVTPPPALAVARYAKKTLPEKLAQVPVFAVTNASGQPYLANVDADGTQVGLIFFSHEEALAMQADMQKSPTTADARVYIMGLDKAYEMVKAKPTPSGIRGPAGEELRMVFRFSPDRKQMSYASRLLRALPIGGSDDTAGVPVFAVPGLLLRKAGEPVVPLFLAKEDADVAWARLAAAEGGAVPRSPPIEVGNLVYLIQQMESGAHPELARHAFVAPTASTEYMQSQQGGASKNARMHQNPLLK